MLHLVFVQGQQTVRHQPACQFGARLMLGVPGVPGGLQIPQETLYKKNVLLVRGRFRPFTLLHNDMLMGAPAPEAPDPTCHSGHEPTGVHLLVHAHMCRMQESRLLAQVCKACFLWPSSTMYV